MNFADPKLERAYLAAILMCAPEPGSEVLALSDYASADNRKLAAAMQVMRERGEAVDGYTLAEEMQRTHGGGRDAAESLEREYARLDWHAMRKRLADLANLRRMREGLLRAVAAVESENIESAIEHACEATEGKLVVKEASEPAHVTARLGVHELIANRTHTSLARTGFPLLDAAIGALRPGTMTTIGGRTGAGKSSLVLAIGMYAARAGSVVGIVSCEDARSVWGPRVLGHLCDVSDESYQALPLPDDVTRETERGIALARQIGLHFAFALNRPLADTIVAIRSLVRVGCSVIAVDYLQAIRLDARGESRHIPTSNAAQAIKAECQAHGVALVLASQLRRPQDNPFKEPYASDLKETGDLENMSEVIALLWNKSDAEDAPAFGKVAKVKWSPRRPRFQMERNPRTGAVVSLVQVAAPPPPDEPQWKRRGQT